MLAVVSFLIKKGKKIIIIRGPNKEYFLMNSSKLESFRSFVFLILN